MQPPLNLNTGAIDEFAKELSANDVAAPLMRSSAVSGIAPECHILMIGGAGYIGNVLIRRLLERNYRVRCLDALLYDNGGTIAPLLDNPNFSFVHGDLRDESTLHASLHSITDVVLLASLVGDPISKKYPGLTREINLTGSIGVFEALSSYPINKFVFTSTCSNYGIFSGDALATEDSPLNPKSIYSETKVAFEQFVLAHASSVSFTPTILRLATAFGLSARMRFDLTVSEFTLALALGKDLLVYDEATWRPYCHVADISDAIIAVLQGERQAVSGQVFNVGSDSENYTKEGIVSEILKILPSGKVSYREGGMDPRNYRVSFEKIHRTLSFHPQHTVQSSIATIVQAIHSGLFRDVDQRDKFYGNRFIVEPSATSRVAGASREGVRHMTPVRQSARGNLEAST